MRYTDAMRTTLALPKTRRRELLLGILVVAVGAALWYYGLEQSSVLVSKADAVVKLCASASDHPTCYNKEIPKLMDQGLSMEDAFAVSALVQREDPSFVYCHVLGHELAEKETAKDPSKWLEVVHRVPSGICSNGGIHGAFQERFRTDAMPEAKITELEPMLRGACEPTADWHPTSMERATCEHALGHLTMYITSANINRSLALCGSVALSSDGRDFRHLCYDGAFMQIYQPLEPEDFDLIRGKEVTLKTRESFCSRFSGQEHASCITESWPLYRLAVQTPSGLLDFCKPLSGDKAEYSRCFNGIFYVNAAMLNFDAERIAALCGGLPAAQKGQCYANSASRFIETDWRNIGRSVALCSVAAAAGVGETCYQELITYSTYNFHPGSPEALNLCDELPSSYKEECLAKQKSS